MRKSNNFVEWCMQDPEDTRKILYTARGENSNVTKFTSEDKVDAMCLSRLQRATINFINLIENEWHADLNW